MEAERVRTDRVIRADAKECFERSLRLARGDDAEALACVHDFLGVAREIAESVYGTRWEAHVTEVYDRIVRERRQINRRGIE
jgi:hypothetical protein